MAAAKDRNKNTLEKRCRKKIATLLSLMGFHDDDPETTIKIMRRKLIEIQEKESNNNNKLSTNITKITFKLSSSSSSVIHHETLVQETNNFSVVPIPKRKRSNIRRLPNSRFHSKPSSSSSADSSKMMIIYDHDSAAKKMDTDASSSQNPPTSDHMMMIINDDVVDDDGGGVITDLNDFITTIGGSQPELVIEKQLTSSDVAKNHGRLLIPVLQVMNPTTFLTKHEKWILVNRKNISVSVYDPQRREHTLNLGQWNMSGNKNYVLKKTWNQLVSDNGFQEGMVLQVLSFRVNQELCFALVRV